MKHSRCFTGRTCGFSGVRHALSAVVLVILCNAGAVSQILQKPIEGDSLSFTGLVTLGYGFGSMDMEQLNQTLKKSNMTFLQYNQSFYNLSGKLPIGKKFLIGMDLKTFFEESSTTIDTVGSYLTQAKSFDFGVNAGYLLYQSSSFLVIPSIGLATGFNRAEVSLSSYKPLPSTTLKDAILRGQKASINRLDSYLNLSLGMESYFKVFSLSVNEREVQGLPNKPVSSQERVEVWLGGFVSYNPLLMTTVDESSNNLFNSGAIGYNPSNLDFGLRLMFTTSLRFITP